jgi:replicative DNA helicase
MNYVMPQNIKAEQTVLGCMMIDSDIVADVIEILSTDDFFKQTHQEMYSVMLWLNSNRLPVDMVSVADQLTKKNLFETIGGYDYLKSLCDMVPISNNAVYYAELVEEQSKRRKLIKVAQNTINAAYSNEDIVNTLDKAEKDVLSINASKKQDFYTAADVAVEAMNLLDARCKNKGKISGLPTGFSDLDYKLGGLQDSELIIIAARPSMGKTSLAENISTYVSCNKNLPTAFFSLEMSKETIMNRTFSALGMVDNAKMRLGMMDDTDWNNIAGALNIVSNGKLIIDDTPHIKANEIRSKCRRIKNKLGDLRLIVVDHLTEMWRPCKGDDTHEHEENVRAMKRLASEMKCPVVLLSQLNRGVEKRDNKRPILSDLKETGATEEVADVVMFIYRDDYYNPDTDKKNIAEIIIAKGRNTGIGTVELRWFGEYTKFAQLAKGTQSENNNRKPVETSQQRRKMPYDD